MKECKDCDADADKIHKRTGEFIFELMHDLNGSHIPPTAAALLIMADVCDVLGAALLFHLKGIHEDPEIEDTETACRKATDEVVGKCFSIIEDVMPIEIHSSARMEQGDATKVIAFIAALKKRHTDEPKH